MASEEVILSTVQRMKASGIPDSIIASTLSELGVSQEQVQKYLERSTQEQAPSDTGTREAAGREEEVPGVQGNDEELEGENPFEGMDSEMPERIAQSTASKVKEHLEEHQQQNEYNQTLVHSSLEEQKLLIAQLHELVNQLHEKFDSTNLQSVTNQVNALQKKVDALYQMQSDSKALLLAVQNLMQKVLESAQQTAFEARKNR